MAQDTSLQVRRKNFRRDPKTPRQFKLREEPAQEAMVNTYVKIEKEQPASHLAEEEFDIPVEDGRRDEMELRELPEVKPPVLPLPSPISSFSKPSLSLAFVAISVPVSGNAGANVTWSRSPRISPKQESNKTVSSNPPESANTVQDCPTLGGKPKSQPIVSS